MIRKMHMWGWRVMKTGASNCGASAALQQFCTQPINLLNSRPRLRKHVQLVQPVSGTPAYLAPEAFRQCFGMPSDVW